MKGGSPAYAYHDIEGLLSQTTNVDHTKPLTSFQTSNHDNYNNLYKVSGGGRKRSKRSKRRSLRKSSKRNSGSCRYYKKKNMKKYKKRLSRKKQGGC